CTDSSVYERCTVAIWVRWTTAIEIRSSGKREEDPENPLVDIKRLASALDTAMKEHKGTISQVPKVTVGLEQSEIPLFREEGQIEHIQMTFQPETHPRKPFHVEEAHSSGAKFEIGCDPIYSRTAPRSREHLIWKPYGGECSFPDYGIFLRCKKLGHATLRIKIVHKSSLWPT
ncbi:hypothetical protein B0H65DRAFT_571260, partial [Neurospora tetraspora]